MLPDAAPCRHNNWSYTVHNPFGMGTTNITLRGYTFHEHLPHFSLVNMNGRLYDNVLCRMLSPDNFIQAPNNTQSFNRYSYCWNNPLKYTDPSGEIITWNVSRGGLSVGINFTPVGIPLGFGFTTGWSNGFSAGTYGEFGYRVGGTGFGKGATISQDLSYNFKHKNYTTTTTVNSYASFGAINAGASYSRTYDITNKQVYNSWGVSAGVGIGTQRSGLGFNFGYGSGGWSYGVGGYHDPNAVSSFQTTESFDFEIETENNSILTACETCPPELKEASANLATLTVVAVAEPTFFGEIALAAYASYVTLRYGPDAVKGAMTYMQRKGERGQTAKPDGTANPGKWQKQHPTKPDWILQRDPHTKNWYPKKKPNGWIDPHKKK